MCDIGVGQRVQSFLLVAHRMEVAERVIQRLVVDGAAEVFDKLSTQSFLSVAHRMEVAERVIQRLVDTLLRSEGILGAQVLHHNREWPHLDAFLAQGTHSIDKCLISTSSLI